MTAPGARRLRGRLFHLAVLVPTLLGLAVLLALIFDVLTDTVSWQVVEPRGSGVSFSFWEGVSLAGSWERVARLELAARGESAVAIDELLSDPEERRKFAARNRVELMWSVDGRPLRWVVSTTRDRLVADFSLARGLRERSTLRASLESGQHLYLNPWLDASFFTRRASRSPAMAGLAPALVGSLWLIVLVILIAVPLGVAAAVYLEEYSQESRLTRLLEVNLRNLAGVPSIVYGLLGLSVFVRFMRLGPVILSAALTLSLLVVPVVIIASREAIRAVPSTLRQAAYGLGATRSQVTFGVVLPAARSGIVTGVILAVARALGETAPLLLLGAAVFVPGLPKGPLSEYTVLPLQIYSWVGENKPEFAHAASAGIVVMLAVLVLFYGVAFRLRRVFGRQA
ncbi:MAG TPA: phosphate ABC transporter permease PstA [Trueperaceae bacterium]|nr:phosphate ABC transporter permease PstA [Trueperaceae bacterium]